MYFCVAIFVCSLLAVVYVRKCHKYWRNRGVASTSPKSPLGDIGAVVLGTKHISGAYDDIYAAFPREPYVGFYDFTKANLMIRDPRLIESILVKDFSHFSDRLWFEKIGKNRLVNHLFVLRGKQWKDLRSKLVTTFSTNKLKSMLTLMDGCAHILDSLIREKCTEEAVDLKEVISRFATDVIGCCIFGLQFNTLRDPNSEFRKVGKIIFQPSLKSFLIGFLRIIAPNLISLLDLSEFPPTIISFFSDLLRQSEEFRKKESTHRNDLMQLILDIRDRDRDRTKAEENHDKGIIDDDAVLSNMFLFYAAGFETTAVTLSFCLYELALQPHMQTRLREEIQNVLNAYEGDLTYAALKKMTYAEMVISETLRKYPPASFLIRVCTAPYQLPGSSYTLRPAERITVPVHSLHHDETYYPHPNRFEPERFSRENIEARPAFAYLPFGDGPRMCMAVRFAKLEMKLCLVRILSKYEFSSCAKTEIPIKMHPRSSILGAKNGIYLNVRNLSSNKESS